MIENPHRLANGVRAPEIPGGVLLREEFEVGPDVVRIFGR